MYLLLYFIRLSRLHLFKSCHVLCGVCHCGVSQLTKHCLYMWQVYYMQYNIIL